MSPFELAQRLNRRPIWLIYQPPCPVDSEADLLGHASAAIVLLSDEPTSTTYGTLVSDLKRRTLKRGL